jgi:hypothetical protein
MLATILCLLLAAAPSVMATTGQNRNFVASLSGGEEVPANDSAAAGQTVLRLSKDGTELHYKLVVANITDVMAAHIHLAPAGANGGVVVWLYPPDGPPGELIPGRTQGILAQGTITEANLTGALAGATLDDLVQEMVDGNAYVNVHTTAFPGGEIRGQIR